MSSPLAWRILKLFSGRGAFTFSAREVSQAFPGRDRRQLTRLLTEMTGLGMIYKVAWGIYRIIPLHADPDSFKPSAYQLAKDIMHGCVYYLGYATALEIHGMLPEECAEDECDVECSERVQVLTPEKGATHRRQHAGKHMELIKMPAHRFFGARCMWITAQEQAWVSDLEKTIVDCATAPHFAKGIVHLGKVLIASQSYVNQEKLHFYFVLNKHKAAMKRYLFLTRLLGLEWTSSHDRMLQLLGSNRTMLDPGAPRKSLGQGVFGLIINVDPNLLKKNILGRTCR